MVAAHPDDEAIGCGGTIRQHVLAGDAVDVVFLTSGEAGGHGVPPEEAGPAREAEAHAAAAILGVRNLEFWREPDGRLRARRALIDRLRGPPRGATDRTLVYAPHLPRRAPRPPSRGPDRPGGDAGVAAAPDVLLYEIWSPLGAMDHIVDITDTIEDKVAAIRAYRSQGRVMRFDEAFRGLARYRGEMHSWPGGPYAEVFAAG